MRPTDGAVRYVAEQAQNGNSYAVIRYKLAWVYDCPVSHFHDDDAKQRAEVDADSRNGNTEASK